MSERKPRKPLTEEQKIARLVRKRAWNAANKEKVAAYNRAWIEANQERAKASRKAWFEQNREKAYADARAWHKANPEKAKEIAKRQYAARKQVLSEYYRERYLNHKDVLIARNMKWRSNNVDRCRMLVIQRRARLRKQTGVLSPDIAARLLRLQQGKCGACRAELSKSGYHLDHIHPVSKGGAHADSNMQLLCPTCNLRKSARDPVEFMQSLGMLL